MIAARDSHAPAIPVRIRGIGIRQVRLACGLVLPAAMKCR